jgi:hypothetical protein
MGVCYRCKEGHTPSCSVAVEPEVCVFCWYKVETWEHLASVVTRIQDKIAWGKFFGRNK